MTFTFRSINVALGRKWSVKTTRQFPSREAFLAQMAAWHKQSRGIWFYEEVDA
jgi:hypothetical protein